MSLPNATAQILNLCCSLYMLSVSSNSNNPSHTSRGNYSSSLAGPTTNQSASIIPAATIQPAKTSCKTSVRRSFGLLSDGGGSNGNTSTKSYDTWLNSVDLECIPKVRSCCQLQVVDIEFDALTNFWHPIYQLRPAFVSTISQHTTNKSDYDLSHVTTELPSDLNLNFSDYDFIRTIWYTKEPWEIAVKTAAMFPLIIIGVVGNALLIHIILKAKLIRASIINLFILNMSVADLLLSLICPWIYLVYDIYQKFMLGEFICVYEGFILCTLKLASVLSLSVISFDRLTGVVFPFKKKMNVKVGKLVVYGIWIISAAITWPLITWREHKERQWKNFHEVWCQENREASQLFWLFFIVLLFWVPLAILILSYIAIIIKLSSLLKKRQNNGTTVPTQQIKYKAKVIRMFFIVLLLFTFCWVPFTVFTFIRNELTAKGNGQVVPVWLENWIFVANYFMFVNPAMNPIIYGMKNENIKRGFRKVAPACLKKRFTMEVSTINAKKQLVTPSPAGFGFGGSGDQNVNSLQKPQIKVLEASDCSSSTAKNRKYYENLLFSESNSNPSLSSFERNCAAYADLGLPLPSPIGSNLDTTTTSMGATSQF